MILHYKGFWVFFYRVAVGPDNLDDLAYGQVSLRLCSIENDKSLDIQPNWEVLDDST
jgi:hypothetical protein